MTRLTALLCLLAAPVIAAEDPAELSEGDVLIEEAEWRDQVIGRTVYYFLEGRFFGREYYARDGVSARFQHVSGACIDGSWSYNPDNAAYCFAWPGELVCFHHILRDGATLVLPTDPESETSTGPQTVERIVDGGFSCEAGLSS